MRRKLTEATELRVQGGTLSIVETRLWSASVIPHPANPREYGRRQYPLGGSGSTVATTPEPGSLIGRDAELELCIPTPDLLAQRLEDTKDRLLRENPLAYDIAAEGVLQPLTVVALTVVHANGHPRASLLVAADGSSRVSAVHSLLDYSPCRVAYEWGRDDRKYRKEINRWIRHAQKQGWDGLREDERQKLRALTVPARVVVGFDPHSQTNQRFHTAVRNFIGLTHIRPPRPYGPAVENEAKADAVLDSLVEPARTGPAHITDAEKHWFAATVTAEEVLAKGLSRHSDVRAASIVKSLLGGGVGTSRRVNEGIRSLTAKLRPKREERVDIAVELILRPLRAGKEGDLGFIRSRRAALQRVYRLPEIEDLPAGPLIESDEGGGRALEQLRDQALEEAGLGHGNDGRLSVAQTELAVKAVYYMAVAEPMALQREIFGGSGDEDDRSPATVLRAMLSCRRGILQAYEVVRAGRRGDKLYEVGESGHRVVTATGSHRELTDSLVRHAYTGEPLAEAAVGYPAAAVRWASVRNSVDSLQRNVKVMAAVPQQVGGRSQVEEEGWDPAAVAALREDLDHIDRSVARWSDRHKELELLREAEQDPTDTID
ncbi:hypothetical protein C7M71_016495 [Peterkaempfera bronchialis]|uniref:Cyclic nucleotide-binding domain-containing protein n=2 Tax=Peterkaempfera bronchialis TaxID=2126346 RepID=A0A345SYH5_9ACTN|nr:hypothetical protein C7M71_016495 [Peterkaempfera bronchialis]